MTPGKHIPIILDDLIAAVEDHCSFSYYYLDRETGEVVFQSERHHQSEADDSPDLDDPFPAEGSLERFIPVEPMESRRGHDIVKRFIASLDDAEMRSRLTAAISKRKFFRSFKDVLYEYPEIEKKWHDMHAKDIKKIIEEWLQYNHIAYEFVSSKELK
jgi:hypothetical protein